MSLIVYNACKAMKLLIITWVHICISFNKLIWLIQKNEKIDILSLLFMPFTGNKSSGAKKGSDEWWCDNFTNIFWVKHTLPMTITSNLRYLYVFSASGQLCGISLNMMGMQWPESEIKWIFWYVLAFKIREITSRTYFWWV